MNCSKCGAQNMEGVSFCGNCGAQMESVPQTPETPQQPIANEGGYNPSSQSSGQQPPTTGNGGQGGYNPSTMYSTPAGGPSNGGMVTPKNYMVEAIVVTVISFLCCCSPISVILGIIAIVKANNVNPEFEKGNLNEAISNADAAKKLTIWAAVITVVFTIVLTILSFAGVLGTSFIEAFQEGFAEGWN